MRILYSHRIQSHDGQGVHVEEMVAALRRVGHEVLVVGPGFYSAEATGSESRSVAVLRRLLPGPLKEIAELAYNIAAYRRLARAAREFRPDLIYERYNLYYFAGTLLARRYRLPLYLEVNAPLAAERAEFGGLHLGHSARWSERAVWRAARRVLVVTGVLQQIVLDAGVPASHISITPNGIDPARFDASPAPGQNPLVLGFVGFVRDWHGLQAIIEGLAHDAGRFRLLVVGDGPARASLEQTATRLGLAQRVQFVGIAPPADIPAWINRFDIALQPRAVSYASPLKIFEYMAAGRPIVAPDQPNIREILNHNTTALLFDPADPSDLWRQLQRLDDDPTLRASLGAAAAAELRRRDYTWTGNARRVTALAVADGFG